MSRETKYRLLGKLSVLAFLSFCIWEFSGSKGLSQHGKVLIPVSPQQLDAENGIIPVEVRCTSGKSSAPNVLDSFTCVLLNNTTKGITAANVIYSIVFELNGSETKASYASTIDTRLHPDFANMSRPIRPGAQSGNVGSPGPISYQDAVIKGVEIGIDYVEFEDGSRLGPNQQGSKIIEAMRSGAEKYKNWLRVHYNQKGQATESIDQTLSEASPPSELKFSSADEEQGARVYRIHLKKICKEKGEGEIKNLLKVDR